LHLEDLDSRFPDDAASDADVIRLIAGLGRKRRSGVRFCGGRYVGCHCASPCLFLSVNDVPTKTKGSAAFDLL
jgi:hypothetical protein